MKGKIELYNISLLILKVELHFNTTIIIIIIIIISLMELVLKISLEI